MSAVQGVQTDRHSVTRDRDTTLAELVWNKPKRETKKNTHTLHTSKNKVHGNIAALLAPQWKSIIVSINFSNSNNDVAWIKWSERRKLIQNPAQLYINAHQEQIV